MANLEQHAVLDVAGDVVRAILEIEVGIIRGGWAVPPRYSADHGLRHEQLAQRRGISG